MTQWQLFVAHWAKRQGPALKGTDGQHAGAIAFLKRVFGSRSTAGRVPTPQDLSVTKQHRNDRWDRCTGSAGDWLIFPTASHRSANQRYFMHNSVTVHRMIMQSTALDSSRSQLCNDTSTDVVRHQITKWRRLQKVVSYDVLHHMLLSWPGEKYDLLEINPSPGAFELHACTFKEAILHTLDGKPALLLLLALFRWHNLLLPTTINTQFFQLALPSFFKIFHSHFIFNSFLPLLYHKRKLPNWH